MEDEETHITAGVYIKTCGKLSKKCYDPFGNLRQPDLTKADGQDRQQDRMHTWTAAEDTRLYQTSLRVQRGESDWRSKAINMPTNVSINTCKARYRKLYDVGGDPRGHQKDKDPRQQRMSEQSCPER